MPTHRRQLCRREEAGSAQVIYWRNHEARSAKPTRTSCCSDDNRSIRVVQRPYSQHACVRRRKHAVKRWLPVLIPDPPGGAIIAWSDGRRAGPRTEPYLQKLSSTGQRMWDTSDVSPSNIQENKYLGGIVSDGAGGAILGWQQSYSISD